MAPCVFRGSCATELVVQGQGCPRERRSVSWKRTVGGFGFKCEDNVGWCGVAEGTGMIVRSRADRTAKGGCCVQ